MAPDREFAKRRRVPGGSSRLATGSDDPRSSPPASSTRRYERRRSSLHPTSFAATSSKAFIVLAENHDPSDALADEIKRIARERLSAYAYPRAIEFLGDLPKTLTGKIRRIELRQREHERALSN